MCHIRVHCVFVVQLSSVGLTTSTSGAPSAGSTFTISCALTRPIGLLASPEIYWTSPDGIRINGQLNSTNTASANIDVVSVQFDPVLASQNGVYMCRATVPSPALAQPQMLTSAITATIQCKC